jgi:subtilase family serine protease
MIPAAAAPGSYYLIAQADGDHTVPETSESNNTLARVIRIGGDLVISSLTVPATAAPGAALAVSDTTANQGTGAAPASVTRFYLSANSSWDGGDIVLGGARTVPVLDAGTFSSGSTSVTLPAGLTTGTYYVIAKADADGAAGESNEGNNTASRQVRVGGDLVVPAFTVPARAGAGMAIAIGDTTTNQGAAPAAATMTRFYLSANLTLDAADIPLGTRAVPPLGPATGHSGSTTVTIPADIGVGTFYVIAKADADETEAETLETNNTSLRATAIGPDLTVSSASLSSGTVAAGGVVTVTGTVTNQGAGSAAASATRYFLSANLTLDAGDQALTGVRWIAALDAGASSAGTTAVTIPAGTAPGGYFLLVVSDADGVVAETAETNNVRSRSIQVTAAQ